uniref:Brain abundant, membrane attached signal protein 1 n=1 Tax=Kryptolebias marmoratus TaxID=37003 RepID=A0A3Q3EGD3_KRYMA
MGAKLSKKKKGYDVSDHKSKKDETPTTDAAKVEDGAPSTGAESTPGKDGVVEETVVSAVAAVAEAAVAPEEPKSPPSDEKAPTTAIVMVLHLRPLFYVNTPAAPINVSPAALPPADARLSGRSKIRFSSLTTSCVKERWVPLYVHVCNGEEHTESI